MKTRSEIRSACRARPPRSARPWRAARHWRSAPRQRRCGTRSTPPSPVRLTIRPRVHRDCGDQSGRYGAPAAAPRIRSSFAPRVRLISDHVGHQDRRGSFRISLMALSRCDRVSRFIGSSGQSLLGPIAMTLSGISIIGLSMAAHPCTQRRTWKLGVQPLRVDWPVYPRRSWSITRRRARE